MRVFGACVLLILCVLEIVRGSSPASSFAPFKKVGGKLNADEGSTTSLFGSKARNPEREQLYEAYNLLHTLAQVGCHCSEATPSGGSFLMHLK